MKPAAAFLAAVLAAAPLPSLGQATPAPAVPSHSCAKPEFPGRVAPDRAIDESALRVPLYRVGYRGRVTGLTFRSMARAVLAELYAALLDRR